MPPTGNPAQCHIVYNGHKWVHVLKFQSLALPNGLIGNLYGPARVSLILKVEGRLRESRLVYPKGEGLVA